MLSALRNNDKGKVSYMQSRHKPKTNYAVQEEIVAQCEAQSYSKVPMHHVFVSSAEHSVQHTFKVCPKEIPWVFNFPNCF